MRSTKPRLGAKARTFEEVRRGLHLDALVDAGVPSIANQWPSSLKRYAYPTIGKLTSRRSTRATSTNVLEPIWVGEAGNCEPDPRPDRGRAQLRRARRTSTTEGFPQPGGTHETAAAKSVEDGRSVSSVITPPCPTRDSAQFMERACVSREGTRQLWHSRSLIFTVCRTNEMRRCQMDRDQRRTFATGPGGSRASA